MTILEWLAAAALCAALLSALLFLRERAAVPCPGRDAELFFLIRAAGRAGSLEQTARSLLRQCESAGRRVDILIADAGMAPEARKIAEILERENPGVRLCFPDEIEAVIGESVCGKTKNEWRSGGPSSM